MTDLELYRWKWHHDVYLNFNRVKEMKKRFGTAHDLYWKEYGAFISVLPRQIGKTEMLGELFRYIATSCKEPELYTNNDVLVVVSHSGRAQHFATCSGIPKHLVYGFDKLNLNNFGISSICQNHLFVDEFDFLRKQDLTRLLSWPWKSVTMVSTLK